MIDDDISEADYLRLLGYAGHEGAAVVSRGFRLFGFRKNRSLLYRFVFSLDYSGERTFAAVRSAHSALHISPLLEGRMTWLPLLHTAALLKHCPIRGQVEAGGGSLTSKQLGVELMEALSREMWSRAGKLSAELAQRGENEMLLSAIRAEAAVRYAASTRAYTVWNAVRCIGQSDAETLALASAAAVQSLEAEGPSQGYLAARKRLSSEGIGGERLADNADELDDRNGRRLSEAIHSGIPEAALQVSVRLLREGVSLKAMLGCISSAALEKSFSSDRKEQVAPQIEGLAAMLEAASATDSPPEGAAAEVLTAAMEITSSPAEAGYRRIRESSSGIAEAVRRMNRGRAADILWLIDNAKNNNELDRLQTGILFSSLKCDPGGVDDLSNVHTASALIIGHRDGELARRKSSLKECADYIAAARRGSKDCGHSLLDLAGVKSEDEITEE